MPSSLRVTIIHTIYTCSKKSELLIFSVSELLPKDTLVA